MHPLEDKRSAKRARTTSSTPTPQPTWLLNTNLQSTFNNMKAAAAKLATTAASTVMIAGLLPPLSTLTQPPPNPSEYLHSLFTHSSTTPPSIPHINLFDFRLSLLSGQNPYIFLHTLFHHITHNHRLEHAYFCKDPYCAA